MKKFMNKHLSENSNTGAVAAGPSPDQIAEMEAKLEATRNQMLADVEAKQAKGQAELEEQKARMARMLAAVEAERAAAAKAKATADANQRQLQASAALAQQQAEAMLAELRKQKTTATAAEKAQLQEAEAKASAAAADAARIHGEAVEATERSREAARQEALHRKQARGWCCRRGHRAVARAAPRHTPFPDALSRTW